MLRLIIYLSALSIAIRYATATSCHDLQQSQLVSLNERMNQMINTISSLLSKSTPKSSPAASPALGSPNEHIPNNSGYDTQYYSSPPVYTTPSQAPQITYMSPPVAPFPAAVGPSSVIPNAILPPLSPYYAPELTSQPDYAYPGYSNVAPRSAWSHYPYDQYSPIQYTNPRPLPTPIPTYSPAPYPPPSYSMEYTIPYPSDYPPLTTPLPPRLAYPQTYPPMYASPFSPVYITPNFVPSAPPYPKYPEPQPQL